MKKFTCKTISKALLAMFPQFSKIELVAGNGYFYFGEILNKDGSYSHLNVASIYVCRLNHMSLDKWISFAAENIREQIDA